MPTIEYVSQFGRDFHGSVVTFGLHKPADVMAREHRGPWLGGLDVRHGRSKSRYVERCRCWASTTSTTRWPAIAVGLEYGVPLESAVQSLASLSPGDKRGEVLHIGGATVINDCYNSNPKAWKA